MPNHFKRKAWYGAANVAGSPNVISAPCTRAVARLRVHPGAAALRIRAVLEKPHGGPAGGSGSGGGGGGSGGGGLGGDAGGAPPSSRPAARQSSIRWARRHRMLPREPRPDFSGDDLLVLNVGGELMQTTRSTLQVIAGSKLAAMFRKGAETQLSYDSEGRVWLDWDPSLFQLVLRYLRETRMNGGYRRGRLPAVQPADEAPFRRLLSYLGLLPYNGATIPVVSGHDPLSDELLSPPPPQPVHPNAAMTAGPSLQPPPVMAALKGHYNKQQQHLHQHQLYQRQQPQDEEGGLQKEFLSSTDPHQSPDESGTAAGEGEGPARIGAALNEEQKRLEHDFDFYNGSAALDTGTTGRCEGSIRNGSSSTSGTSCKQQHPPPTARKRQSIHNQQHQQHQQQQQQPPPGPLQPPQPPERHRQAHNHHNHPVMEPQPDGEGFIPEVTSCNIHSTNRSCASSCSCSTGITNGSSNVASTKPNDLQSADTRTGLGSGLQARQHEDGALSTPCPASASTPPPSPFVPADGTSSDTRRGGRQAAAGGGGGGGVADTPQLLPRRRNGGGGADRSKTKLSPPPIRTVAGVSQLFYISTDFSEARGLRVSVHTEEDIRAAANAAAAASTAVTAASAPGPRAPQPMEPFDIFLDTTYGEGQISLTFVSRRELLPGGVFLGLTSRAQLDRKGAQIPCYGWKSNGCTYNDHTGGGRLGSSAAGGATGVSGSGGDGRSLQGPAVTAAQSGTRSPAFKLGPPPGAAAAAAAGGVSQTDGASWRPLNDSVPYDGVPQEPSEPPPLWRKGDSVEVILRQGQHQNQLLLKVNGQTIDVINRLPSFRHWSWYVGLWAGGDVSCAVFQRDQYAVYWGDYAVKRYL